METSDIGIEMHLIGFQARPHYTLEVTGETLPKSRSPCPKSLQGRRSTSPSLDQRINAAHVIRRCGFEPVPIISSRRLRSFDDLDTLLQSLIDEAAPSRFLFVGGDPAAPAGPFADTLALLRSGVVERYGIRSIGIVGYPDGQPEDCHGLPLAIPEMEILLPSRPGLRCRDHHTVRL
ncbi:hypothetical protein [Agrobacterium sp. T29]|uniref:hypothetical protein n=1 Tax=Agrobacterium sp. T29 TaxID=2580515 RepID=UPI001FF00F06|nr:hypothetical protein [Agrobacterium sp. T29]